MWRILALALAITTLALLARAPGAAEAKDGRTVFLSPDSGELGTTVELSSQFWPQEADVAIYAGFSPVRLSEDHSRYAEPEEWWGPVATARSDDFSEFNAEMGTWSVTFDIEPTQDMPIPREPGFVLFKAVTESRVVDGVVEVAGTEETVDFALAVDGRRPDGAGGINLKVSVASGIADEGFIYDVAPVGAQGFSYYYAGVMRANAKTPFESTQSRLADSDYYVFVRPTYSGTAVLGPGAFEQVEAALCSPQHCEGAETRLVKRVSVRDGELTDVEIVIGPAGDAPPLQIVAPPDAGAGPAAGGTGAVGLVAAIAGLAGVLLVGAGWRLRGQS